MRKADPEDIVGAVIKAAGGTLIGRVRLQKVFYLLDQLGLKSGFNYDYHYYGPYSANLSSAIEDACAFSVVNEEIKRRVSDGVAYSVYTSKSDPKSLEDVFGSLGRSQTAKVLNKLKDQDATVLELAATIHWLKHRERVSDWKNELEKRKGIKTKNGRKDMAVELLRDLGLEKESA